MDAWQIIKALIVGAGIVVGFGLAARTVFWLLRYIAWGSSDNTRFDRFGERLFSFFVFVFGQKRVIGEFGGVLHFFVFWGFLVLQVETLEYMIRAFWPSFNWGLVMGSQGYHLALFLQDIFGLLVFVALCIALLRRYVFKPDHIVISNDALVIILLIQGLMVTKFLANGTEIALGESIHDVAWTPIATFFSGVIGHGPASVHGTGYDVLYNANYFIHIGIVLFFANWIPRGKHLHLIGAMPNVFFRRFDSEIATLPYVNMERVTEAMMDENAEVEVYIGAKQIKDLTWKQLLDTYACTECARCEAYCPAYNTGKALNPMMVIHKIKDAIKEQGRTVFLDGKKDAEFPNAAGGIITRDELWACTTCGACVAACPVLIEHVNTIVDLRRYLAFTADVPQELANTYKNMEQAGNPWGMSNSKRADWASDMGIPHIKDLKTPPDYLFFVGCAGSFDDRQKKVTRAFAKIMQAANVSFAILGKEEKCNGDTARRTGNEYLYWTLASEMIEKLNKYNVTKVVTTCPHCYNVIKNEYPQLGGNYEVVHHTNFIKDLMDSGRIGLEGELGSVTFHDSCYLGRWNGIYDAPREILNALPGTDLREPEANRETSMCCGAGGGRMWMEEDAGKRVNYARTDQLLATEARTVALACPFCMTMIDDGLKHRGADEHVKVKDIAEIVADAMVVLFDKKGHHNDESEEY
ncbi:MAG: hypothetical protein AUK47_14555 [Deltaproteobacteria bacterium CG2_30_63_29]|nr:MAG: hypothetical protein AUK47_14555 [Deltaproteobacteria bacterium CG2_30_63_29]PJB37247.1 MAG: Fe-S oxidoreductase [Deltaproteobacteria bacterium CG_4_9_14_3_um_filter_63_12]